MKVGLFLFTILCVIACSDSSMVYRRTVQNDSNKTITLYFLGNNNSILYQDTVVIGANITEEIYYVKDEGSSTAVVQPCAIYTDIDDTVLVEIAGGGQLLKSFHDEDDWMVEKLGGEQTCTFIITDADIQ